MCYIINIRANKRYIFKQEKINILQCKYVSIVEAITFICKTTKCLERLIITTNLSTQREFNLSKVLFDVFKTELLRFCLTKTFPYLKNFLMMLESYNINFLILPSLFHDEIFLTNFHLCLNYSCLPNYFDDSSLFTFIST